MSRWLKDRIISSIRLLPYGQDIYLTLAKNRMGISYSGIYESHDKAIKNCSGRIANYYDIINKNKSQNLENELKNLDNRVLDSDYPLLFWLSKLVFPDNNVLELGGNIGHAFYSFEEYINYPKGTTWTIAELPEAVNLGNKIVDERNESRLSFINSEDISKIKEVDIFMTAGTLQYMEASIFDILSKSEVLPPHILIHNLPVHKDKNYWTLQNLDYCEVPYRIYSSAELIKNFNLVGYNHVDTWNKPRGINIPFHLDVRIEGYYGYYFKRC